MARLPSAAELASVRGRTVPDLVAPHLRLLLVGINPSLLTAWTGHHFARPGNRLWRALHAGGLTPRLLAPHETGELLAAGIGITNLVSRATARADELAPAELRAGRARLEAVVEQLAPTAVAVLGLSAYRAAFSRPRAAVGPLPEPVGGRPAWLLPNPSGLNAHYRQADLDAAYGRLARWLAAAPPGGDPPLQGQSYGPPPPSLGGAGSPAQL